MLSSKRKTSLPDIHTPHRPTIVELGVDLLNLSRSNLLLTLGQPLLFFVLYFASAFQGYWVLAVVCTIGLSFTTYGSTSHDLVHENLKINKIFNDLLLSFMEGITFRSGHAYRMSHLYHHKRYPHEDDVEGAASRMTLLRSLLEGVVFQFKIYFWALSLGNKNKQHAWVVVEGITISLMAVACILSLQYTFVYFVYLCLMVAGSWIIPFMTSYAVHTPDGESELQQTRLFRGRFFSIIAFDHLYHLEHHMYPMVPHKNWPELAKRLDGYFERQGVKAHELKGMGFN